MVLAVTPRIECAFDALDLDGDGEVDLSELRDLVGVEQAAQLMPMLSQIEHDGAITRDAWRQYLGDMRKSFVGDEVVRNDGSHQEWLP